VADFALTSAERTLLAALRQRGVPFVIIGMGAAVLEGAPVATQDIDLWFERADDERIQLAAKDAGGFWISGFGMQPPCFGGEGLDRLDVVLTAHGLEPFAIEYPGTREVEVDGVTVRILPLERVIASKRAIMRPKDLAQMPALEATLLARAARKDG
jgi:predicted nucleotidyltransferase